MTTAECQCRNFCPTAKDVVKVASNRIVKCISNATASATTAGSFKLLHYYVYGLAFLPFPPAPCLAGWQNEEAVNINLNVMMLLYSNIIYNQWKSVWKYYGLTMFTTLVSPAAAELAVTPAQSVFSGK